MFSPKRIVYAFLIGTLAVLFSLLAFAVLWSLRDPEYVQEVKEYLEEQSKHLPEEEQFQLTESAALLDENAQTVDWSIHAVSRENAAWDQGIGAGGLMVIGRKTNDDWHFNMLGEESFEGWLDLVPNQLLGPDLKELFRLYQGLEDGEEVSSNPIISRQFVERGSPQICNLPYPAGESYKITNLPGDYHHQGLIENAIDFGMEPDSTILSICDGTVVEVKEDSDIGGCSLAFANDANFVRVQLTSKLRVLYFHLAQNSVQVNVGDKVRIGKELAKVGETGFVCGAHLHIVLERLCNNGRICGSKPLNFAEFKGVAPSYDIPYLSDNTLLKDRLAAEKRERERKRAEIARIKDAVKNFLPVYACSTLKDCDKATLITTSVTEGLMGELFPSLSFCFNCVKWDSNILQSIEFIPFTYPGEDCLTETNEECFIVTTKEIWISETSSGRVSQHGEITHYTVVNRFLVRENGIWKVDGYKIVCGYTEDQNGKMIPEEETVEQENLEGCLWQPPETIEGSSSESTP